MKKEEVLRAIVDNVGKRGTPGEHLQNVISVAMLSEGWDAKNVTHIMGLRAFTSQLLCEQVIGRGLRRVGYDTEEVAGPDGEPRWLFRPEFVNVFGVPLSIFQHVGEEGDAPPPPKPSTQIEVLAERHAFEIRWPNVVRVDQVVHPVLSLDWDRVGRLQLDPATIPIAADLAPALGGAAAWDRIQSIDLELIPEAFRFQRVLFKTAHRLFEDLHGTFRGTREYLVVQLVRIVERFLASDKLVIPSLFHQDSLRRRILLALSMDRVVQHLGQHLREENVERIEPIFDEEQPLGSTGQMRTWYTTKPCQPTSRSQISPVVADSAWEAHAANVLEQHPLVQAYAKNDHLGFQVHYLWNGSRRRFVPDFVVRLVNGRTLVLEIKGEDSDQDKAKRSALDMWVQAVNVKGGFGVWSADVVFEMARMHDVLDRSR